MALYVLDTDHLSLILRGHPNIRERLTQFRPEQIAITIVTAEEQLRGRLAQVNRAVKGDMRVTAYRYLHKAISDLAKLDILDYDRESDHIYQQLKRQGIRVGSQDLRIAAIALANHAIVATRNHSDFGRVPGLTVEDWTK